MACGTPVIATATRLDARDRPPRRERVPRRYAGGGRCRGRTRRATSTGQPCAHRWRDASTSSGWWTTTSRSISASSNSIATQRSASRPSAEPAIRAGAVPGRCQLLAGVHSDGLVVELRSGRRLKSTLPGSPPAVSTRCGCFSPGKTSNRLRTGSTARCSTRLVVVADLAAGLGLALIPTLFTGHMSGVNWIPPWALGGSDGDPRFRVVSGGRVVRRGLRNWYTDQAVEDAQVLVATEAAAALAGHEAVWAWDLGNENSNCVIPPNRPAARAWLARLSSAIRTADDRALVTIGLHMEDLEEDRLLGPREASEACDLLSMHGYPIYARWAHGPTDAATAPVPGPRDPLARGRSRRPVQRVRTPDLPP